MSEEKCEFQINDVVRYGDKQGVVVFINGYVHVLFDGIENKCLFNRDGFYDSTCRLFNLQKLELVERPKKKVKKRFWQWLIKNDDSPAWRRASPYYYDEWGTRTDGTKHAVFMGCEIQKIESDFIEIEVEE